MMSTEELDGNLSITRVLIFPIVNSSVMFFAYGFYILLFSSCVCIMRRRRTDDDENHGSNLYLLLTVVLFVLSTVFVVIYTISLFWGSCVRFTTVSTGDKQWFSEYYERSVMKTVLYALECLLLVLLNITVDTMLITRCYVIWGSDKRVVITLVVLSVIVNGLGLTGSIIAGLGISDSSNTSKQILGDIGNLIYFVYNVASAVVNTIITALTAGRIWWCHRQLRARGVQTSDRIVESISRIILESGICYPIFTTVGLIVRNTAPAIFDFAPLVALSAGIAPTMVMVRAKLGANSEHDRLSEIRFSSGPQQLTTWTTASVGNFGERRSSERVLDVVTIS